MYLDKCDIVEVGPGVAVVSGPCRVTGKTHRTPPIPIDALVDYVDGTMAQEAFPMLPPEEREFLISGTSPEGWRWGVLGQKEPRTAPFRADSPRQVIARRGDYGLVRLRDTQGNARYALECQGEQVCSDEDGDSFYEHVGMVSGSWELWLATRGDGED